MIHKHDGPGGRIVMLSADEPRCEGKPAGPSGYQVPDECWNCFRRITARTGYPVMQPPAESPCPQRIEL